MASQPLISVVMPCFNTERYIGEAIESIIAQQIDSVQTIVIDDGSTDHSADIARSFGTAVECQSLKHSGIASSRNAGVALARGKYLTFLDADDLWTPRSLRIRLDSLDARTECVFGGVESFISPELSAVERARIGVVPPPITGRLTGSMLIDRRAFDRVGPFDESLAIGEMFDWVSRAIQANVTTRLTEEIVLRRRIHNNNTVTLFKHNQSDYLRALKASLTRQRNASNKNETSL